MPRSKIRWQIFALAILSSVVVVGLLAVAVRTSYQRQRASAELRYVSTDEVRDGGLMKFTSTFWISNRSEAKILVALKRIETKANGMWTTYSNAASTLKILQPREAIQIKIDTPVVNSPWRVRLDALGEMKGLARFWTLAKLYWGDLRNRLEMGKSARPLPPLGGAIYGSTNGSTTELISNDITD
jgi:hypothetical protein